MNNLSEDQDLIPVEQSAMVSLFMYFFKKMESAKSCVSLK